MAKFHVTITDNETGEVIHDADSGAIIAGIDAGDGTVSIGKASCDSFSLAAAILCAKKAIDACLEGDPFLQCLVDDISLKKEPKAKKRGKIKFFNRKGVKHNEH